jgi:hypothetical protein
MENCVDHIVFAQGLKQEEVECILADKKGIFGLARVQVITGK